MSGHDCFPRDFRNVDVQSWKGDIPIGHTYTLGVAGDVFFRKLRDSGQITASVHEETGVTYVPPRIYCPQTFDPVKKYAKVGPEGTIDTFTLVGRGRDGKPLDEPRILAMIRFDGAEGGLLHWVGGCKPEQVQIGMRVKAVFEPKRKRTGQLSDIRHFAPAGG